MKKILEISAAEGGEDSRLFAKDLAEAYERLGMALGWKTRRLGDTSHKIQIEITGKDLTGLRNEPGGHRIQRVPTTEKRGRVHTSTVTVSVTDTVVKVDEKYNQRSENDFRIEWFSGTGAGGQHRNKHANSCRVIHIPTGLKQERQGRKRDSNRREAMDAINKLLDEKANCQAGVILAAQKRDQKGSGQRGDKIRTYRFQDDQVKDHQTGRQAKCSKVMKGRIDLLW